MNINNTTRKLLLSNVVELADVAAAKDIDVAFYTVVNTFSMFGLSVDEVIATKNPAILTREAHAMLERLRNDSL